MLPHDKALALSAVEVEMVRDMRSRLGRRAVSDKALGALGSAFLTICARVDLSPAAKGPELDAKAVTAAAATADMKTLQALVATLQARKQAAPDTWPATVAAGAPQAILSRRLVLAGREPAIESGESPA